MMNEKVAISVITAALLHTSLGATPTLRVTYGLNVRVNQNVLECLEGGFVQSPATFTFRNPNTMEVEKCVTESGQQHQFFVNRSNESRVTCTYNSVESAAVNVPAVPQYVDGVTAIKQYMYSDSNMVDIECPFEVGRLRELYEFSWKVVLGPLTNNTLGAHWLTEEDNRILHVNISAPGSPRNVTCVGTVLACSGDSDSCSPKRNDSPTIMVLNTIDRPSITEPPASVRVSQYESATFNCTATGSGDISIKWSCSDGSNCSGKSDTTIGEDGSVTSTLNITRATGNLAVTCHVIQNLIRFTSETSNVEVRLPPSFVPSMTAQLIFLPVATTTATPPTTQQRTDPSAVLSSGSQIILTGVICSFVFFLFGILVGALCYRWARVFTKPCTFCTGDIKPYGTTHEHPSSTDTPADTAAPVVYEEISDSSSRQKIDNVAYGPI